MLRIEPSKEALEKWQKENMIDADIDDGTEAPLPQPFEYLDAPSSNEAKVPRGARLMYPAQKGHRHREHRPQPFSRFYPISQPIVEELPAYDYSPLDTERDEYRLLALLPHDGNPESTVQCGMLTASLEHDHYCYVALRNTRGFPYLTAPIIINGRKKLISKNVEVFLRNFRFATDQTPLLWIREICLNRNDGEEKALHYNEHRENWIFSHSCVMLDMDDFMEEEAAQEALRLAPKASQHKKLWKEVWRDINAPDSQPRHFPIRLGQYRGADHPPLPYQYLPLDIVAGEIRLLVLNPAKDASAPLVGALAHEPLYSNVVYECLSYTWGKMDSDHDILLNGQTFKITLNLDRALRDIRHSEHVCVLWVDALCINQQDLREKNRQVPRMYSVYENAVSVLLWLGSADAGTDMALDLVEEIANDESTELWIRTDDGKVRINYSQRVCRAIGALYRLFDRPYFTRLWVVQEIAISSNTTCWCGQKRVSWFRLANAAHLLHVQWGTFVQQPFFDESLPTGIDHVTNMLGHIHRLDYHRNLQITNKRASLLHLALSSRITDCFDPRDKLYGLWDLASDTRVLNMQPDYSKPIVAVYIEFTKAYIEHYKRLDIICAAFFQPSEEDMPSWCPDWRHKPYMQTLIQKSLPPIGTGEDIPDIDRPLYCASRKIQPAYSIFVDERRLVCAGLHMDTISHIVDLEPNTNASTFVRWRELAHTHCHRDHVPLSDTAIDDQLWSMIFGEASGGVDIEITDSSTLRVRRHPRQADFAHQNFHGNILDMLQGRQLVFTEKGYMALAPQGASEVGIGVYILLGCSVPVLLQRHKGHYHFRGGVYVQGWMNGEMLDGLGTDEEIFMKTTREQPLQIV